jgi:hypothetical protein
MTIQEKRKNEIALELAFLMQELRNLTRKHIQKKIKDHGIR